MTMLTFLGFIGAVLMFSLGAGLSAEAELRRRDGMSWMVQMTFALTVIAVAVLSLSELAR